MMLILFFLHANDFLCSADVTFEGWLNPILSLAIHADPHASLRYQSFKLQLLQNSSKLDHHSPRY